MVRRSLPLCLLALSLLPVTARAASRRVTSSAELEAAVAQAAPGDTITLASGSYAPIQIDRPGSAEQPITVTAETIGGAVVSGGTSRVAASAAHVIVRGLRFAGAQLVLEVGSHHIHVTRNHFEVGSAPRAVHVQGNDQELSYNNFQNKSSGGSMVQLDASGRAHDGTQRTFIHHNLFLNHAFTGGNGGECIATWGQITRVEHNLFEQCNGDPEIVTIKASDGFYRFNTFRGSTRGQLVLRYARNVVIEGNYLLATRGLRLYGPDMKIINNYIEGGTMHVSHGASGYLQIERMLIAHNTFVDTEITGRSGTLPPQGVTFVNNLVHKASGPALTEGEGWSGTRYEGNMVSGGATLGDIPASGGRVVDARLVRDPSGVFRLGAESPAVNGGVAVAGVEEDIDGHARMGVPDVGADEQATTPVLRRPLTRNDVGPNASAGPVAPPPDGGALTTDAGSESDGGGNGAGGSGEPGTGGSGGGATGGTGGTSGAAGATGGAGGSGGGAGSLATGGTGGPRTGGAGGRAGTAGGGSEPATGPGCGCRLDGTSGRGPGHGPLAVAGLGLLAIVRRRRGRSRAMTRSH